MKIASSNTVHFLRVVRCSDCGGQVRIVRNIPGTAYQEEHVSAPGQLCPGSDREVRETGAEEPVSAIGQVSN